MPARHESPIHDDELHALLDGGLDAATRQALQARVDDDATASATLKAWQDQRERLRALHAELLTEPVPASLLNAAVRVQQARVRLGQWSRWGGMAAALLLAFTLGWTGRGQMSRTEAPALASLQPVRAFIRQAAVAHAVYSPELRHPVEVAATQEEHLVQWLSRRLGRPLKLPRLDAQGFDLVGGRLLPGDVGARAQFMYQNAHGERVTLYLGSAPNAGGAPSPSAEFRYSTEGPVPSFYWVEQGFAYALSGPLSRPQLLQLAQSVYAQL